MKIKVLMRTWRLFEMLCNIITEIFFIVADSQQTPVSMDMRALHRKSLCHIPFQMLVFSSTVFHSESGISMSMLISATLYLNENQVPSQRCFVYMLMIYIITSINDCIGKFSFLHFHCTSVEVSMEVWFYLLTDLYR